MSTFKRKAALGGLALMMTAAIVGCGKNEQPGQPLQTGEVSGKGAATAGPKPTLHLLTSHAGAAYAKGVKVADDPYLKELSKLSGYDLQFEFLGHAQDYDQQLTVRFVSNNLPDMIRTYSIESPVHSGAVEQGVFRELGPLIDKYGPNLKKKIPQEAWDSPQVSKDGKIYGIPALGALPAAKVVYVRQDWLDKLGIQQPKTLDEYVAYFEAVKQKDMNGNGDPSDEYGFYVRENMAYADLFFKEFGVSPNVWNMKDGQLIPDMIRPEMKDAIRFWKQLYDKGYINPNLFTNKGADWGAGIKQGKAGMWEHEVINYNSDWRTDTFVNQPDAKISLIEPPVGPKGQGALTKQYSGISYAWVIPASSKQAEAVIKFLDWAWSDDANKFFAYGIEGTNYTVENGAVKWDANAPINKEKGDSVFYQFSINPRGDGRMVQDVLKFSPNADVLIRGIQLAKNAIIKHDSLNMPALKALETHPELVPGTEAGTLFLDMFAKVVTGKEELDPAFDKFVSEWKRRGGDEAIKEATAWYNKKTKK